MTVRLLMIIGERLDAESPPLTDDCTRQASQMMRRPPMRGLGPYAVIVASLSIAAVPRAGGNVSTQPRDTRTQIVLLGTGNPSPSPDNSGPSTAIVVNGEAYL